MTSKGLEWRDLEMDSASPTVGEANPDGAIPRKKETVKPKRKPKVNTITIACDEYELQQATIRRQESTIVQLRQVYESEISDKERELQIMKEKAKKMDQALTGTEKQLANVVKLQMIQLETSKGERGTTSIQDSQTDFTSCENSQPTSLPMKLVEREPLVTKLESNIPKADLHPSHMHLGTPCVAFDKVVQENLRLKKFCQELISSKGQTTTIILDDQDYEEMITRLKQEVMQVKLELQNTRTSLILKENGQQDALAQKLVELQKEKVKLSKSVVAKASLLSIYNKEYERLKQAYIQLQQQVSEKHNVGADTGKSAERQPGDGRETSIDTTKSEALRQLTTLQAKHAEEIERLNVEKTFLKQENIKMLCLNKTYAESIQELSTTRRTVDEQPISMADMRKELEKLRDDRHLYAEDIKTYSSKMEQMECEMNTKDTERLKQKQFYDLQITQLQEQYQKLTKENTELQRQLNEVTKHNRQLKYQCSRSPQTSTESAHSSVSGLSPQPVGQGIVVADGVDEEELICKRCYRKFYDQKKLEVHEKKCMDS